MEIHEKTINVSGGGAAGLIDAGPLESVLQHIQNDAYYPDFIDKITHLFFSANKFHCFQDGNKRIALSLSAQFLLRNIIEAVIMETIDSDEELKLRLLSAIQQGDQNLM